MRRKELSLIQSLLVTACAVLAVDSTPAHASGIENDLSSRLASLATPGDRTIAGQDIAAFEFLSKLYAAMGNKLVWSRPSSIEALVSAIDESWKDGLLPSDFHADFVRSQSGKVPSKSLVDRDIVLSDALLRLLYQLYFGKVDPNGVDPNWNFSRPGLSQDPVVTVAEALASGKVEELINRARVNHPLYAKLRELIERFTAYEMAGGWGTIAEGPVLKAGQRDARVPELRARLRVTGEYAGAPSGDDDMLDDELVSALKEFQRTHAISPDGVLGPETVGALNVPAHERIDQIRVNLERGRWLLRDLKPDMVIVNVAGYYLHLFLKERRVWSTRVVVGQPYTKTPIFTEPMESIVLNPDWTVPRSIIRNEIFPKASANPTYLDAHDYYLIDDTRRPVGAVDLYAYTATTFPYGVVQRPGPRNALGQVKFLFPNRYSVYMHDTPSRQLFEKASRNFSHGCIRVENPLKLAELILSDRLGWSRSRIDAAVADGKLTSITLPDPLPVLVLYWTVDPSAAKAPIFYKDAYGRDATLLDALNAPFRPRLR
jgi:murein L,D-transpeptidase YcbB/YkuD